MYIGASLTALGVYFVDNILFYYYFIYCIWCLHISTQMLPRLPHFTFTFTHLPHIYSWKYSFQSHIRRPELAKPTTNPETHVTENYRHTPREKGVPFLALDFDLTRASSHFLFSLTRNLCRYPGLAELFSRMCSGRIRRTSRSIHIYSLTHSASLVPTPYVGSVNNVCK